MASSTVASSGSPRTASMTRSLTLDSGILVSRSGRGIPPKVQVAPPGARRLLPDYPGEAVKIEPVPPVLRHGPWVADLAQMREDLGLGIHGQRLVHTSPQLPIGQALVLLLAVGQRNPRNRPLLARPAHISSLPPAEHLQPEGGCHLTFRCC